MTLRELEDQALRLSAEDRWQLINTLVRSLLHPTQYAWVKPKNLGRDAKLYWATLGDAKSERPATLTSRYANASLHV
ncbi:hypothetical protein LC612_11140 [Nostoc sp. CHAB 5834]|nr:hypothetical protein [Nostoc sp. CHAB 5834]